MVKKAKREAAPTEGAETAGNLRAAWPFPKSVHDGVAPGEPAGDGVEAGEDHPTGVGPAAEPTRIRVDQVRLFTDATQNVVERIALDELRESPFNPRTRYDEKALQDLAETIRGVGVAQPLLVRKLSVDGLLAFNKQNPAQAGNPPPYEIVFGHRRYRAARLAGETHVPAILRELTDAQAAQLQAIENVQRENPDAIDEARGYLHYITVHKVSKDQLADEIGLSRSHVYSRLKLLSLPDEIQKAVVAGEIAIDVGLAIARLHTPKIQATALATLRRQHPDLDDGGKRSVRRIKSFLHEKYTLDLDDAVFDTKDPALLEGADACTTCTKRSGNAPEYADVASERTDAEIEAENDALDRRFNAGEDVDFLDSWNQPYHGKGGKNRCTDPECYEAKKKAHLAIQAAKLQAEGKTVIAGAKARTIVSATGEIKGGYVALKDLKSVIAAKNKKKAAKVDAEYEQLPNVPTIVVQDPRGGQTFEVVKLADVTAAGVKVKAQPAAREASWVVEQRKREEQRKALEPKAQEETRFNFALLGAVRGAAAGQPLPTVLVQHMATLILAGVDWENRKTLATLHGMKSFEQLQKAVGSMPPEKLTTLMLDCALVDGVQMRWDRLDDKPAGLYAAAKHYDVDVAEIRRDLAEKPADTNTQDLQLQEPGDEQDEVEEEAEA